MMDLTFPSGGGGYKKPSCRIWAHPGSQSRSKPFTPSSELLHGGILEIQGQLSESEFSPLPTAAETLRVSHGIWVSPGDVVSPTRAVPSLTRFWLRRGTS